MQYSPTPPQNQSDPNVCNGPPRLWSQSSSHVDVATHHSGSSQPQPIEDWDFWNAVSQDWRDALLFGRGPLRKKQHDSRLQKLPQAIPLEELILKELSKSFDTHNYNNKINDSDHNKKHQQETTATEAVEAAPQENDPSAKATKPKAKLPWRASNGTSKVFGFCPLPRPPSPTSPKVFKTSERLLKPMVHKPPPEIARSTHVLKSKQMTDMMERLYDRPRQHVAAVKSSSESKIAKEREQDIQSGKIKVLNEKEKKGLVERLLRSLENAQNKQSKELSKLEKENAARNKKLSPEAMTEFVDHIYYTALKNEKVRGEQLFKKYIENGNTADARPPLSTKELEEMQNRLYHSEFTKAAARSKELADKYMSSLAPTPKRSLRHVLCVAHKLSHGESSGV